MPCSFPAGAGELRGAANTSGLWVAVAAIALAVGAHQAWTANNDRDFTKSQPPRAAIGFLGISYRA